MTETPTQMKRNPVPVTRGGRFLYIFTGIFLPIICYTVSLVFQDVLLPEWQSGRFADYAKIVTFSPVSFWFAPFLLYSMVSLFLLICDQERWGAKFVIRFGIYTGVIVGVQFTALIITSLLESRTDIPSFGGVFLLLSVAPAIIGLIFRLIARKIGGARTWAIVAVLLLLAWGVTFVAHPHQPFLFMEYTFASSLFALMAAPVWFSILMILVARRLLKENQRPWGRIHLLAPLAWGLAAFASWRFAVQQALEAYSALPPQPPGGCYVATAAARGHRSFVRSALVTNDSGQQVPVNMQMCHLKSFEVILSIYMPLLQMPLRRFYDIVGPKLAALLSTSIAADVAYILLKPAEWMAQLFIAMVPGGRRLVSRMYPGERDRLR